MSLPTNYFINDPCNDKSKAYVLPFPDGEERSKTAEHDNRLTISEKSRKSKKNGEIIS